MNSVTTLSAVEEHLELVLKDIPLEHVVKGIGLVNRALFVRYFKGFRLQVLGRKRVRELLQKEAIEKKSEDVAQVFITLWNRANGKLYHAIYNLVKTVNEDVDKIEHIEDDKAEAFLDELLTEFDATRIYLAVLFNEVKFSREAIRKKLEKEIPFEVWPPPPEPEEAGEEKPQEKADES